MMVPPLLVAENQAAFNLSVLTFSSLRTLFERVINMASAKINRLLEGIRFVYLKKWMWD